MPSRLTYLSVTFKEDVFLGVLYPSGTTVSLPADVARSLGSAVTINGVGSASTSPVSPVGSAQRQQTAAHRMFGLTGVTTYTSARTFCGKLEAEGAFDAVRLHVHSHELAPATGFAALVAATDTTSVASVALAGQPSVGGVQTAALRASIGAAGWAQVTFAGANSGDIAAAPSTYSPAVLSSDWIELQSVPRAAGEASDRPLLMFRLYHDGAANGAWNLVGGFTANTDADKTAWQNASAFPWWRDYQTFTITTDAVTTPATNIPSTALQGSSVFVGVEFGYRNRALSVMGVGDSLMENTITYGGWGSWGLRGCALASSQAKPVTWINGGASGQNSSVYVTAAESAVPILRPTHVLYEVLSPNDPATVVALTAVEARIQMARLQRMVRLCKTYSARLVVVTPNPNNAYVLSSDTNRLAVRSAVLAGAASNAYDVLDVEYVIGDGASPARYKTGFAYDTTHLNNVGLDPMAYLLRDYLASQ